MYLTFDDGPHPEITLEVLDILRIHQAKATFFCVGENVSKYPDVVGRILTEGHTIGNHTHRHLNGWKTNWNDYKEDVEQASREIQAATGVRPRLFRPPYGRIGLQAAWVLPRAYQVVMWDVVAGDFVQDWTAEKVRENVLKNAKEGSVVVFHDSPKAHARLILALKSTLIHFGELGFRFEALPQG
jgi:peptidoglycan/xylan/chitin deacetylase (PgdA/CDA1 family)